MKRFIFAYGNIFVCQFFMPLLKGSIFLYGWGCDSFKYLENYFKEQHAINMQSVI